MADLLERLCRLPSAALSDCFRGMHTMDSGVANMTPGLDLAGPAFTVSAEAGSIITVHAALLEAPPGTVLVVGGETGRDLNSALFGKLMSIQAKLQGILGLVVDGAVRDIAALHELGFPVFARCTAPRVGMNRRVGQTQVPTSCGGIIVQPGDYIRGDDDGVTVIPSSAIERVVLAAEQRVQKEAEYVQAMRSGKHITDLIGFPQVIRQRSEPDG